ncbi:hypothetical protein GCM10020220_014070 [Nonomuraea rubra]
MARPSPSMVTTFSEKTDTSVTEVSSRSSTSRAEDREQPHDQRQPGGHEAAEDDDEQHQQHGHGDGLGAGEVGGGLVVELAEEGD